MRQFKVTAAQDGKHVVKASSEAFPGLNQSDLFRALKHKDIKIDGKRTSSDIAVKEGQTVEVWLPDELFDGGAKKSAPAEEAKPEKEPFKIVCETNGLIIVNKSQGIAVHSGKSTGEDTLIDLIRRKTKFKEAELCHRIDMNTGGLVMVAKDKKALADAVKLFKDGLVTKRYRALVLGTPEGGEGTVCDDGTLMYEVTGFLEKTKDGKVYIHDTKQPRDLAIATRYRVLETYRAAGPDRMDVSDIECELVTGRTHQIRAQFAHLGYPIVGDGNYGRAKQNSFFTAVDGGKVKYQQLFACRITLGKISRDNIHFDVSGKSFRIEPDYSVMLKRGKKR